jgi:hypothetical protein
VRTTDTLERATLAQLLAEDFRFLTSTHDTEGFSPQAIFAENILDSEAAKFVDRFSQHHYSG